MRGKKQQQTDKPVRSIWADMVEEEDSSKGEEEAQSVPNSAAVDNSPQNVNACFNTLLGNRGTMSNEVGQGAIQSDASSQKNVSNSNVAAASSIVPETQVMERVDSLKLCQSRRQIEGKKQKKAAEREAAAQH